MIRGALVLLAVLTLVWQLFLIFDMDRAPAR